MVLNKEQILNAKDHVFEDIDVPEWGGSVRVRSLTAQEREEFEAEMSKSSVCIRAHLIARTLIDDDGNRIFETKDIVDLGKKNAVVMSKLFDASSRISGLRKQDIDDLEKK